VYWRKTLRTTIVQTADREWISWGTDDPTRASFAFSHGLALSDAGHDVQIFLTAEATYLMRKETVDVVKPVGWPPLAETMAKIVSKRIPVFA
jgi:predicted peroxiredoxin